MHANKIVSIFNNSFQSNQNPPIWFLRQAGRHIPEYYTIRDKTKSFIEFCLDEDLIDPNDSKRD